MNVIIGFSAPFPGPPLFLERMVTVLLKGFNEAEVQLILHAAYIIITGLVYNFCLFSSEETYCEYSHSPPYYVKADGILISMELKEIAACFRKYIMRGLNIRMISVILLCELYDYYYNYLAVSSVHCGHAKAIILKKLNKQRNILLNMHN